MALSAATANIQLTFTLITGSLHYILMVFTMCETDNEIKAVCMYCVVYNSLACPTGSNNNLLIHLHAVCIFTSNVKRM